MMLRCTSHSLVALTFLAVLTCITPARGQSDSPGIIQVSAESGGLRIVNPALTHGRLLTGFPILHGEAKGEQVQLPLRTSKLWSGPLNAALYVDLAILKALPKILDNPRTAYSFAERFLLGSLQRDLAVECYAGCSYAGIPFRGWRGEDEFERERSYRRFVDSVVPRLLTEAPDMPLSIMHVLEMELGPYNRAKGGFPLRMLRPSGHHEDAYFGDVYTAQSLRLFPEFDIPDLLPISDAEAEALLKRLGKGERRVFLGLAEKFELFKFSKDWTPADPGQPRVNITLDYAELFSDSTLQTSIYRFSE